MNKTVISGTQDKREDVLIPYPTLSQNDFIGFLRMLQAFGEQNASIQKPAPGKPKKTNTGVKW